MTITMIFSLEKNLYKIQNLLSNLWFSNLNTKIIVSIAKKERKIKFWKNETSLKYFFCLLCQMVCFLKFYNSKDSQIKFII